MDKYAIICKDLKVTRMFGSNEIFKLVDLTGPEEIVKYIHISIQGFIDDNAADVYPCWPNGKIIDLNPNRISIGIDERMTFERALAEMGYSLENRYKYIKPKTVLEAMSKYAVC